MLKIKVAKKKAFTVAEVTVSIAVLAIAMLSISGIFASIQRSWYKQKTHFDLIQDCRWAMRFLSREARLADNSTVQVTDGGSRLSFNYDPDADGHPPVFRVEYEARQPYLLRRTRFTGPWQEYETLGSFLTSNPSGNPFFSWDNTAKILTAETTVNKGSINYTLRTKIRPRN